MLWTHERFAPTGVASAHTWAPMEGFGRSPIFGLRHHRSTACACNLNWPNLGHTRTDVPLYDRTNGSLWKVSCIWPPAAASHRAASLADRGLRVGDSARPSRPPGLAGAAPPKANWQAWAVYSHCSITMSNITCNRDSERLSSPGNRAANCRAGSNRDRDRDCQCVTEAE
jgi:hypothetical protein